MSKSEENYGITDLEGLAVIYTVTKLRPYLLGKRFDLLTDHCALCVLNKKIPQSARLRRWAIVLSEFYFNIVYTKGDLHKDIDSLSRAPVDNAIDSYLESKVYCLMPKSIDDWVSNYTDEESLNFLGKAKEKVDDFELKNDVITRFGRTFVPNSKRESIMLDFHEANARHGGFVDTMYGMRQLY